MKKPRFIAPIVGIAILLAACQPAQTTNAVDGDTIDTSIGRIRVLGIDTPEEGEPCYAEAKARVVQLTVGGETELVLGSGGEDRDHYGRLLRHVINKNVGDLGEILIRDGLANARYDSLDGYGRHMHQDLYRRLDAATPHRCGPEMDAVGDGGAAPVPAPAPGRPISRTATPPVPSVPLHSMSGSRATAPVSTATVTGRPANEPTPTRTHDWDCPTPDVEPPSAEPTIEITRPTLTP